MSMAVTHTLRVDMLGEHLPGMRLRLRWRRGAGALVAVLLMIALAGTGLAVHYAAQHAARQMASSFEAGRVFGAWVLAAHRASQERDFSARLALERSFALTPAELRGFGAVPPGLPERAGRDAAFTVGIMDDGAGTAMAFGVLEPDRAEAVPALRQGAIAAGLAAIADAGAGTAMAAHVPAIEAALGRVLAADGIYVTADAGLHYDDRTLYRRAQPGRRGLNRMETALDAGRQDVTGIAAADGFTADVSGDADAGGTGRVTGDAGAADLEAGSMEAGAVGSASLSVSAQLLVGRAVAGPATVGTAAMTGRLEAGSLNATGGLTAGTLAAAAATDITGSSSAGSVAGEMLAASGTLRADRISATGLHGPDAAIGNLTVGSCGGC